MKHRRIMSNCRGESYIDLAVAVLVFVSMLVLAISLWSAVTLKQDMRYMAQELIDTATVSGQIGPDVMDRYTDLCAEAGITPTMRWDADYFDASDRTVQLGDTITVTLTHEIVLPGFGGFRLPFTVTVRQSGLSRKYWK